MDMKRFEYLLDLHGADFARWAPDDAALAQILVDADPAARALRQRAQALDTLLSAPEAEAMPEALKRRIMAALNDAPVAARPINDNYPARRVRMLRALSYGGMALAASVVLFALAFTAGGVNQSVTSPGSPGAGPQQMAASTQVDLFLLAMADPLFDEAEDAPALMPARTPARTPDGAVIDLFLQSVEERYMGMTTEDL